MSLAEQILKLIRAEGADLIGFADLTVIAEHSRQGFSQGISMAVALKADVISSLHNGPTKEYYTEYERANNLLDHLSWTGERFLQDRGFQAKGLVSTTKVDKMDKESAIVPHKTVATMAGMGWIGKSALLVTEPFGSAIRINTVLTDAVLPTGSPVTRSRCGQCNECVYACPAQAITGKEWHADISRDVIFDTHSCEQKACQLALERIGLQEAICGICIAVCPWTQRYIHQGAKRVR